VILHLVDEATWLALAPGEVLRPPSLASEGFVHCTSGDDLLLVVANAFYRAVPGGVLALTIDPALVMSEIRWEHPPGTDPLADVAAFPHIYGPLDPAAVVDIRRFVRDDDGSYVGFTER
jgi:uncharacterized protein (DUF952 family)